MAIYQDEKLVKRAHTPVSYTPEQIDELRACMDPNTGPLYFISNFMYIQHAKHGRQKLNLFDYQVELLENYTKYRKSVNMLGRQLGKCLFSSVKIRVRNKKTNKVQNLTFDEFNAIIRNDKNNIQQKL